MRASEERVVFEVSECWRKSSACSDPEKKAELEEARREAIKRFSETSEYKAILSSMPGELQLLHTDQPIKSNASRKRIPRLAKVDVDYTKDPYTCVDDPDFTDDEMSEHKGEENEEELASDEEVSDVREEDDEKDGNEDDSVVVSDHESEPRRSPTCEEPVETDNGSDLESDGYPELDDSDE